MATDQAHSMGDSPTVERQPRMFTVQYIGYVLVILNSSPKAQDYLGDYRGQKMGGSGLFIVGSPAVERLRQFDARRVNDLQNIQSELVQYWRMKGNLPPTLEAMRDDLRGFAPPDDPQTGKPYEYRIDNGLSFSLCATFNASSPGDGASRVKAVPVMPRGPQETWAHGADHTCFSRTIDPQLYPPSPYGFGGAETALPDKNKSL